MQYTANYDWTYSFSELDTLFVDDILNWDETTNLALDDYSIFSFISVAFFPSTHYFLDNLTKTSFLDLFFLNTETSNFTPLHLFYFVAYDSITFLNNNFLLIQSFFYTDYQDFFLFILHHSPELTFALNDYFLTNFSNAITSQTPSIVFDSYSDSLNITISEFLEYFILFCTFVWFALLFLFSLRINCWVNTTTSYITRLYNYFFWISKETRLQFEGSLQILFFIGLYTTMMIVTFDDDQEEMLEFFNSSCFYFFLFTFVFYLYKYSIHFFSFLEPSKTEGRSIAWIINQFKDDFFNTVALTLRFLVLMIRLNIYDGVDDVLDSYYIFVADFDEDEYFTDLFFSIFTTLFFDNDVNDDRSFLFEDEIDFIGDLFTLYFIIWGKFSFFLLFILEVLIRTTLALYVTYLLIFEINAVNRSYTEDLTLLNKNYSKDSVFSKL